MNYLKQIQELSYDAQHKGIAQITIDILQATEMELNRDESQEPIERDELGSHVYNIHVLLAVFNPLFKYDIEVLSRLSCILAAWRDDVEFVNRTLGIPLHRG